MTGIYDHEGGWEEFLHVRGVPGFGIVKFSEISSARLVVWQAPVRAWKRVNL